MTLTRASITLGLAVSLAGCLGQDYTPMSFTVEGTKITARGVIDGSTPETFATLIADNSGAETLVLEYVEGSVDDEANLIFSRMVREAGLSTVVPSGGMIASGGTDLFVAGEDRILQPGACVGVHSWGGDTEGRLLPRDAEDHDLYLDYYDEMDIPGDFYWYTLDSAGADDMHWMTQAEADSYDVTTNDAPPLGTAAQCEAR